MKRPFHLGSHQEFFHHLEITVTEWVLDQLVVRYNQFVEDINQLLDIISYSSLTKHISVGYRAPDRYIPPYQRLQSILYEKRFPGRFFADYDYYDSDFQPIRLWYIYLNLINGVLYSIYIEYYSWLHKMK